MDNAELDSILKKARLPQPPEELWADLPQQVVRQLDRAPARDRQPGRDWFPRLAWGLAVAICIVIAFAAGHWRGRMETKTVPASDVLTNGKLVRETLAMFPNQVRAILQDERGLHLILSDRDNIPASVPLYVHVCDGQRCESVVTFSGQDLELAGQKITVLADSSGAIILEGNKFAWSSSMPNQVRGKFKIEARNLGTLAL